MKAGTTYSIGRDPKSDISMNDSRVSWHHGVLRVNGDKWVFEDGGSTNGTFLGQQKVDRVEISSECVVHLGNPDDGPVLRCVPQAPPAGLCASHSCGKPFVNVGRGVARRYCSAACGTRERVARHRVDGHGPSESGAT